MEVAAESIWLATAAVDMRTGIDRLPLHAQQALGRPPCDGTAYVFANRRRPCDANRKLTLSAKWR